MHKLKQLIRADHFSYKTQILNKKALILLEMRR